MCSSCGRAFARSDSLTRHVRIHTKGEPARQSNTTPLNTITETIGLTGRTASISGSSDTQIHFHQQDNRRLSSAAPPPDEYAFAAPLAEFDGNLAWPDAEQLLQTIISSDWNSLTLPPEAWAAQPSVAAPVLDEQIDPRLQEDQQDTSTQNGESHKAIQSLSNMINNVVSRAGPSSIITIHSFVLRLRC